MRSFRFHLAVRFTGLLVVLVMLLGGTAYFALRYIIYAQVDEALLRLAEIEAASTSDAPESSAHFHDNVYHPAESQVSRRISRYAEIWTAAGVPVARSRNLADGDLYLPVEALRAGAEGKRVWFTYRDALGTLRSLIYPLDHGTAQRPGWVLQVAAPLDPAQDVLSAFLRILVLIGLFGALGSFAGTWYFAGQAMRPVGQIAEQASRLEPGRSAGNIRVQADSAEHRRLVEVLNDAFDRLLRAVRVQRQVHGRRESRDPHSAGGHSRRHRGGAEARPVGGGVQGASREHARGGSPADADRRRPLDPGQERRGCAASGDQSNGYPGCHGGPPATVSFARR